MKDYYVYIITNYNKRTLYVGVTNSLERRMSEHKRRLVKGFSSKYRLYYLVYFEVYNDIYQAIYREKKLKAWKRAWKDRLINEFNPDWKDLSQDW